MLRTTAPRHAAGRGGAARRPRRRFLALAAAVAVPVAGTTAVVLSTSGPASAALGDQPMTTYNMQGATSGQDSKWTTTVGGYIRRSEVVALQEVGAAPPGVPVAHIPLNGVPGLPPFGNAGFVQHNRWQFGLETYEVYFLQTDRNGVDENTGQPRYVGGRNNVALVTQRPADEVTAIANPAVGGRAALGVRFGNTWYFSLHARSLGGRPNDAPAMVQAVAAFVAARPQPEHWVVLGDFNRDPDDMINDLGHAFPVYAARDGNGRPLPTIQTGHAADYAVADQAAQGIQTNRLPGASADHYAFALGALRGAAEPTARYHSDRAVESMGAGGVLDATGGHTENSTDIISWHRDGGSNQAWSLDFYNDNTVRFRGRGSNRCVDIHNSTSAAAGRQLILWDCTDQASQRWHVDAAGDNEVNLRNVLRPDLCMDVQGAPSTPDAGNVIVWPCSDAANQRWLFTPAEATHDVDREPVDLSANYQSPVSLEGLKAGGMVDAFHGGTGNNTPVISFHRNGGANQGWNLDWQSSDVTRLRGVGSNRCLDIHNSTSAAAGRDLVLWDCTGQASQQWRAEQLDNGQVLFHSVLRPDLCMDVEGAPPVPDAGNIIVWNCTGAANQQFLLTAFDPTGTPEPDRPHDEL